ncbi:Hypothetical_protein [Hexamita inflata]|uniref:Hypothetical_protein n=1 Tax=Hexamita inflata TaxID=28002 RepID=A0AA86QII0_9EUKA|nr:Hypothetical protein HINF_LOCUS39985 [Hexamita inflata]
MSDSESSSNQPSSEPKDSTKSFPISHQTQKQDSKQFQNAQQESSFSDDSEQQKQMKLNKLKTVERREFQNAGVQTGKGYQVKNTNGKQYRTFTVPTVDKEIQTGEEQKQKCVLVETQTQTDIFQFSQNELIKFVISSVNNVKNEIVQRELTKEQKSANVILNEIDKIAAPGVDKCINTYLSLRRQGKDYLYIDNQDYIENKFTDYRDLQAIGVGVQSVTRIPIIKKEHKDQKESIFPPGANLNHSLNTDLNPEKQKNETEKPKIDKAHNYFTDPDNPDVYNQFYGAGFENSQEDYAREQFNQENANREQNNYQQQQQNHPYAATTNDLFPKSTPHFDPEARKNETEKPKTNKAYYFEFDQNQTCYDLFDVNDLIQEPDEYERPNQEYQTNNQQPDNQIQTNLDSIDDLVIQKLNKLQKDDNINEAKEYDQITNPGTDSKWSENQWDEFNAAVFKAIKNYFNDLQLQTPNEALLHYRARIVGVKKEGNEYVLDETVKPTKIHLNFQQIANDCDITEKECRQKFQTLQEKILQAWPQNIVDAVLARINELWQQIPEPDIATKKKVIRETIDQEFHLIQQVQYRYKEISNKINYIISNLK